MKTYSAVTCLESLRLLIAVCAEMNWQLHGMDVQHAYLYGKLDFALFMKKPQGFDDGNLRTCWKLHKAVYGSKQGGRCFRQELHKFMISQEMTQSRYEPCIYFKQSGTHHIIVAVYVDDLTIGCNHQEWIIQFKANLREK